MASSPSAKSMEGESAQRERGSYDPPGTITATTSTAWCPGGGADDDLEEGRATGGRNDKDIVFAPVGEEEVPPLPPPPPPQRRVTNYLKSLRRRADLPPAAAEDDVIVPATAIVVAADATPEAEILVPAVPAAPAAAKASAKAPAKAARAPPTPSPSGVTNRRVKCYGVAALLLILVVAAVAAGAAVGLKQPSANNNEEDSECREEAKTLAACLDKTAGGSEISDCVACIAKGIDEDSTMCFEVEEDTCNALPGCSPCSGCEEAAAAWVGCQVRCGSFSCEGADPPGET